MAGNTNRRTLEATFSELLDKIQRLTASNLRRLQELVDQGVYIPGSDPDDNSEVNLPSGKRDETRKSPTPSADETPVEDQLLGDVVNGPEDDAEVDGNAMDAGADIDGDALDAEAGIGSDVPAEESTVDPEVRDVQTGDNKPEKVPVKQLEDFDDGFSMDIFDDDGFVNEDDEGNDECLVVSLNGLHCDDDCHVDSFDTTIAPIYDNDGNIDQIALRDAAFKIASEVLDTKVTDADTVVLQTKQDAAKKLHDAEDNLAFLPANFYQDADSPTTVLFPRGTTSQLAQIIGNNPILSPAPSYVKDADHVVMPPTCIGSAQNADWAPYVCLVKRPALLGGFSLSIACMCDDDLGEDKHAMSLRNKGIKELHNDLQTFAKYHGGTVINRPKKGTDAIADAADENCICTYQSTMDDIDEAEDAESSGSGSSGDITSNSVVAELERIKKSNASPEEINKQVQAHGDTAKAAAAKADADATKSIDDGIGKMEGDAESSVSDIAKAVNDIGNNSDVKNGGNVEDLPKTDDAAIAKFDNSGETVGEAEDDYFYGNVDDDDDMDSKMDDDFLEDGDVVPDDENIGRDEDELPEPVADVPFPGFRTGGEYDIVVDVLRRTCGKDGCLYRFLTTRKVVDRKIDPLALVDAVLSDESTFEDICDAIADEWCKALNGFIGVDMFRYKPPVDFGPDGFDDHIYAAINNDGEMRRTYGFHNGTEIDREELLRDVFLGRTEDELYDAVVADTDFLDDAANAVCKRLEGGHLDEIVDAL